MEEIAQVYARSLFEVAKEHDKLDVVREQLGAVRRRRSPSNTTSRCSSSRPTSPPTRRSDGLQRALEDADEAVVNFLELLIEQHRMPALFRIRREFEALWEEENKLLPVQVTSAIELDESTVRQHRRRHRRADRPAHRTHERGRP